MMALGFFPYFVDDTGLLASNITTPLDFYGVHFDVVFPDVPSVEITGSQFRMAANGGVFGVGPGGLPKDIVPSVSDAGNTLILLSISSLCLLLIRQRKCPYENIPVHGDREIQT